MKPKRRPDPSPAVLPLGEAQARRLLLAQAIDMVDDQGKLVGAAEREQIEQQALRQAARPAGRPDPAAYLQARTEQLLSVVERRHPRIAALQEPPAWHGALAWLVPLAAMAAGAVLDRIDNPHQVNLLSPPLLAFLLWNLAIYLALLAAPWLHGGRPARLPAWLAGLRPGWRRTGHLRTDVQARFRLQWLALAGPLELHRAKQLLHTGAAAWAVGVGLSIAVGGLVREYRVGWESTLLDLDQVHGFLRLLFAPVLALLPVQGFSLADLERLHFGSGLPVARQDARHWVGLYIALLALVVAVPRALLATYEAWRQRRLARALPLDLAQPYFAELLARINPARVRLCLVAPEPEMAKQLRALLQQAGGHPAAAGSPWRVLHTPQDDELSVLELPPTLLQAPPPELPSSGTPAQGWLPPWRRWWPAAAPPPGLAQQARQGTDLVLLVAATAGALEQGARWVAWLGQPALVLLPDPLAGVRWPAMPQRGDRAPQPPVQQLRWAEGVRGWSGDGVLREALLRLAPPARRAGMERLMQAWAAHEQALLADAMGLLASGLAQAAREAERIDGPALGLRQLLPAEREAATQARAQATRLLLQRLREGQAQLQAQLLRSHGLAPAPAPEAGGGWEHGLRTRRAVDAPQAGAAGAASGAALGATVDLVTGGLTLGAASMLGALFGGGAALAAAVWKNRAAPGGGTVVQPGEELLQALTVDGLLAWLAVMQRSRAAGEGLPVTWRETVAAQMAGRREAFAPLWPRLREPQQPDAQDERALALLLQELARELVPRLP